MTSNLPMELSAVSRTIASTGAKTSSEALPREVIHNLQFQHDWTDLRLHMIIPNSNPPLLDITSQTPSTILPRTDRIFLISGLPPRHMYFHPDFLIHLVTNKIQESDVRIQREWVLPTSTGEKWMLKQFCQVFDALPIRDPVPGARDYKHYDAKRVICGMKANDGVGGDGTIVYYIMQEGEIKPRQN